MKTIVWFGFVLGALSAAGKVVVTKVGHRVTLECGVSTFSQSLVWRHRGDLITRVVGKSGFQSKGTANVALRSKVRDNTNLEISVTEADGGKFTCVADGRTEEHTLLLVSVSVTPSGALRPGSEATLQCQVKDLDQGSTVQWKRPDGGSLPGSHTVQLKPVAGSDAGTWQCTFTYGRETFSENLIIIVEAPAPKTAIPSTSQSPKDVHKPACVDCTADHPPGDVWQLLGLSWWVWLAIGAGCLVLILLMVFVIVLSKRIRRRKRKFLKMKNGQLKPKKYCQCDCRTAAAKPRQGRRREKPSALPL